jgi:hypothetical protein
VCIACLDPHLVMDAAPNNSYGISSVTKLKFLLH